MSATRIRAILRMAGLWAVGWSAVGGVVGAVLAPDEPPEYAAASVLGAVVGFAIFGAVCGGAFAALLMSYARHRALTELSLVRLAGVGAIAGFASAIAMQVALRAFPPTLDQALRFYGWMSALGALSAAGSLALARRGDSMNVEERS